MKCIMIFTVTLGLAAAICSTCDAQDSKTEKQEQKTIQEKEFDGATLLGKWKLTKGQKAGENSAEDRLGELTIDKEKFVLPVSGDEAFVMKYKLDATKSPIAIDFEITDDEHDGKALGIIRVKENRIILCYHPAGDRPAEFVSTEDNGNFLFEMERQAEKFDVKKMKGTWVYVSGKARGNETPDDRLQGEVTIDDKSITLSAGPGQQFVMGYEIDDSQAPAAIDLEILEGPAPAGAKALGIIKFDDGMLTVCYNAMGETRPKSFESTEENGFFLFVLEQEDQ